MARAYRENLFAVFAARLLTPIPFYTSTIIRYTELQERDIWRASCDTLCSFAIHSLTTASICQIDHTVAIDNPNTLYY